MTKVFIAIIIYSMASQAFAQPQNIVDRQMQQTDLPCRSFSAFQFCGEDYHFRILQEWLTSIRETEVGTELLDEIAKSRHDFLIIHSDRAVSTAGSTISKLTSGLTNGVGTDVVVKMNFDIPSSGSHLVSAFGTSELIEFTADQNLFHELSHARHTLSGTLATMREVQAIIKENVYRKQLAELQGRKDIKLRNYRARERDKQIWFGE